MKLSAIDANDGSATVVTVSGVAQGLLQPPPKPAHSERIPLDGTEDGEFRRLMGVARQSDNPAGSAAIIALAKVHGMRSIAMSCPETR